MSPVLWPYFVTFCRFAVSIPALSCIERGKSRPSYKTVGVIAEGLGVSEGLLVLMSLEDKDIKPEKLPFFQMLKGVMID